jgi:hypothetical protein
MVESYEDVNESSGSKKCGELLDQVSNCQLFIIPLFHTVNELLKRCNENAL